MLDWQPEPGPKHGGEGKGQRRARPLKRWADGLDESTPHEEADAQQTVPWRLLACSREDWKAVEEAYVRKKVDAGKSPP